MSEEESKLLSIQTLSAREAVDALEVAWHKRYVCLVPLMQKLKVISAFASGIPPRNDAVTAQDKEEDYYLVFYQMSKGVDAALGDMQKLTDSVMSQFKARGGGDPKELDLDTTLKLEAVYARWSVITGDLHRYLDRFRKPKLELSKHFKKAVDQYMLALRVNCEDGKAFSGLYIVAATGGSGKILLSAVYLLKSVTAKIPFNEKADIFVSVAQRIASSPSELRDVPIPARACVACVIELVSIHMTGQGRDRSEALARAIAANIPNKDFPEIASAPSSLPELPWDVLVVLLLVAAIEFNSTFASLIETLKLFIGRALTFKRPLPILAALDLVMVHPDLATQVLTAIKREAAHSFLHPSNCAPDSLAKYGLSLDHLLRFEHGKNPSADTSSNYTVHEVAAARICVKCGVSPSPDRSGSSSRQRVPTPESIRRSLGSKPIVILDAANLACRVGQISKVADIDAVVAAYDYWTKKDHVVKVFVSEKHAQRSRSRSHSRPRSRNGIEINLDAVYGLFDDKSVVAIPPQNHDDSYMIEYALRVDGVIVSNDMYRDWISKHINASQASKWVQSHVIAYTFVDSMYIPNPDFNMPHPCDTHSLLK